MYTIVEIPNKGKGMRATMAIPLGTRILCESPLLEFSGGQSNAGIAKAMKDQKLSREDTRAVFALQNDLPGSSTPFLGIVKANAVPLAAPGITATRFGLFKDGNRINHSCLPNAHVCWNSAISKYTVHAIREIKSGEEITSSYILFLYWPYEIRQENIQSYFNFKCICERCMKPLEIRAAADAIYRHMMEIEDANTSQCNYFWNCPEKYLTNLKVNLELLAELRMDFASQGYKSLSEAFKVAIVHSDEARARVFAIRAFERRRIMEGDDSPGVQEAKQLVEHPANLEGCGKFKDTRWEQRLESIPKDLNDKEFEAWLWSPGWLGKRG